MQATEKAGGQECMLEWRQTAGLPRLLAQPARNPGGDAQG